MESDLSLFRNYTRLISSNEPVVRIEPATSTQIQLCHGRQNFNMWIFQNFYNWLNILKHISFNYNIRETEGYFQTH